MDDVREDATKEVEMMEAERAREASGWIRLTE